MSTNGNCLLIEVKPRNWYYVLENLNAPKNASDWHEFAKAYGPFASYAEAHAHLGKHHANPGGFAIDRHPANPCPHGQAKPSFGGYDVYCPDCGARRTNEGEWPGVVPNYERQLDPVLEGLLQKAPENKRWCDVTYSDPGFRLIR